MHKLSTGEPSDPSPPDSRGFLNWLCDWRSYQISTAPSILRRGQSFRRVFVSPIWLWSSDRNLHNLDPDPAAPCPTSSHPKDLITEFLPGGICAPPHFVNYSPTIQTNTERQKASTSLKGVQAF